MLRPRLLRGLALLLLAFSCAPPPAARRHWRPEQGLEALLAQALGPLEGMGDLTAEARLEWRQGRMRARGTALVQWKAPDLFRVEVRGPFYSHVFTALQEGDSLLVYGPAVGGAWKGLARGPLLLRLTGVDLGIYPLSYALLGLVEGGELGPVDYPRADRAIATLRRGGLVRRLWIDLYRGLVTQERLETPAGEAFLTRRLQSYRRVGKWLLPARVEIDQGEGRVELDYRRYRVDQGLERADFYAGLPQEIARRLP